VILALVLSYDTTILNEAEQANVVDYLFKILNEDTLSYNQIVAGEIIGRCHKSWRRCEFLKLDSF
jgi:hypothetical protein